MHTGHLTPLGRQLRTVLANLSVQRVQSSYELGTRPLHCLAANASHSTRNGRVRRVAPINVVSAEDKDAESSKFRPGSVRVKKKSRRFDHLTDVLKDVGHGDLIPAPPPGKSNLSYVNFKRKDGFQNAANNARRHAGDIPPDFTAPLNMSLESIVRSYIRAQNNETDMLQADKYTFSEPELQYLHWRGYTADHIAIWADIVTSSDSLRAARKLEERVTSSIHIPVFVLLHLLRRTHISAAALRILTQCTSPVLYGAPRSHIQPRLNGPPLFLAVIRLLRHARRVWPQALASIVSMWLRHLQRVDTFDSGQNTPQQRRTRTFELNKLLSLISLRTSVNPFKDNRHQEAAVVPILQYMSEHNPPLLVDRTGYRAVIRIQLAQRKTAREQQWAELKALSWPPWKVDRTGMDASIGLDYGTSRAGATLDAMRSAGYHPLEWEEVARMYAGWDTDGTPTIQRRALLSLPGFLRSESKAPRISLWAARIECTRTVQEAWACYLAWEDLHKPHDQRVYLAIFSKLSEAAKAQGKAETVVEDGAWPVFPGDGKEISSPPRSTHLHTYTRTRPPSVDELYNDLRQRGVVFEGHCLALLVRQAPTFPVGLDRLIDSSSVYPQLRTIRATRVSSMLAQLPHEIFDALVSFFLRFAMHHIPKGVAKLRTPHLSSPAPFHHHIHTGINTASGVARATELLRYRPAASARAYLELLSALAAPARCVNLHVDHRFDTSERLSDVSKHLQSMTIQAGALIAYELMQRTLALYQDQHRSLDLPMFTAICQCTEHAAWAAWFVLQNELEPRSSTRGKLQPQNLTSAIDTAKDILTNKATVRHLVDEFNKLVGRDSSPLSDALSSGEEDPLSIPRLLAIPSSIVLHRYIRALGWLGAYNELLDLIKWMHTHHVELAGRLVQDRRGEKYMSQALTALRVFLERSWIVERENGLAVGNAAEKNQEILNLVKRLERPAGRKVVDECRDLVESVEMWGGWPTDEEVRVYVRDKRFESL